MRVEQSVGSIRYRTKNFIRRMQDGGSDIVTGMEVLETENGESSALYFRRDHDADIEHTAVGKRPLH